jgi:3-phosphoshikimate 1-carboxyvinyltransferase
MAEDIKRTIEAFRAMGVDIEVVGAGFSLRKRNLKVAATLSVGDIIIHGVGLRGLKRPTKSLYLGNSGTTMRLLPGILAGQNFEAVLEGDESLSKRPMQRIIMPLKKMGASIKSEGPKIKGEVYPPLKIHGGKLKAIKFNSKIASAQVKSCILLAGLYADGITSVTELQKSRDHTERMLKMFGADMRIRGCTVSVNAEAGHYSAGYNGPIKNRPLLSPGIIEIPGDISSAAFFIVAGCILPGIKIIIRNTGLNPTRTGIIDILKRMGADIETQEAKSNGQRKEPAGNIIVKSSKLRGVTISPKDVVRTIDEIPIIMIAACFAKGRTTIKGIEELRVKETDRIKSMVTNLRKIGADINVCFLTRFARSKNNIQAKRRKREIESNADKYSLIVINGGKPLHGARVSSFGDHRTAMSMLVAGLGTKGKVIVTGLGCINKSFPNFERLFHCLPQTGYLQ